MVAGSNPNDGIVLGIEYHRSVYPPTNMISQLIIPSELRVEYLNPPYMSVERPQVSNVPKQVAFNTKFQANISIPKNLKKENIKGMKSMSEQDFGLICL